MPAGEAGIPDIAIRALDILRETFADALLSVHLHGSAVAGGLRPQSDVDMLAVIGMPMTEGQRRHLVAALLAASGRHTAVADGPRPLEVMVFLDTELAPPAFPARAEFVYGEWLRAGFEAGDVPRAASDPEHTLLLAQAAREAVPLYRNTAAPMLPEIPPEQIARAMREALPSLVASLRGDERNVLLTLARMWHTAVTGSFAGKDVAASWAAPLAPPDVADMLIYARDAYLGRVVDDWQPRQHAAQRAAGQLHERLSALL